MSTLSANLSQAGLTAVGYQFFDEHEDAIGSRITAGIIEGADGWYSAAGVVVPAAAASVRWNDATYTELVAVEYFSGMIGGIPGSDGDLAGEWKDISRRGLTNLNP